MVWPYLFSFWWSTAPAPESGTTVVLRDVNHSSTATDRPQNPHENAPVPLAALVPPTDVCQSRRRGLRLSTQSKNYRWLQDCLFKNTSSAYVKCKITLYCISVCRILYILYKIFTYILLIFIYLLKIERRTRKRCHKWPLSGSHYIQALPRSTKDTGPLTEGPSTVSQKQMLWW